MSLILMRMTEKIVKAALKQCLSSAENTFKSILITASSFLMMFNQNPKLAAMLSHSTFTLEDLIKPKTALFLVTDDTTSTADPILGMIISQIQSFLVDKAYHSKTGKLNVRMNFVLDEFASIPIPNMDKALATHRSRNIRYYLCVQSLALLKERYENPEKLLSNCASTLYLGSTEHELLRELEAKLGTTCITSDGKERPLCSQAELMTLERTWSRKEAIYMNLAEGIRYCTMLPRSDQMSRLQKDDILKLPISVRSWILLRYYLDETWDPDVFRKVIDDYYDEMPLFEVNNLFSSAEKRMSNYDFQEMLNYLFKMKNRVRLHKITDTEILITQLTLSVDLP